MKPFFRMLCPVLCPGLILFATETKGQTIIFSESMGAVNQQTAIAYHETNNGFDNDELTMSQGFVNNPENFQDCTTSYQHQGFFNSTTEPLIIPYFNGFTTEEDIQLSQSQGFKLNKAEYSSGLGGYLKIDYAGYLETPEINFSEHNHLNLSFRINTYYTAPSVGLSIYISGNGGVSYQLLITQIEEPD